MSIAGAGQVVDVVVLPPAADDGVPGRRPRCRRSAPTGAIRWASAALVSPIRGRSSKTSTAPSVSPSSRTSPRVGCMLRGGQLQQRRLARAVGPEHHPALVGLDGPVDAAQQVGLPAHDVDPGHPDDRAGGRSAAALDTPPSNQRPRAAHCAPTRPDWQDAGVTQRTGPIASTGRGPGPARRRRSARTGTAPAPTSRCGRPAPRRSTCACSTPTAPSTAHRAARRRPTRSGTATCPASARASATATGCTAPTTRGACGYNPAKLLLDPYARAVDGDVRCDPRCSATPATRSTRRPRRPATRRRTCRAASSSTTRSRWDGDRPLRHLLGGHRHLRGARQGASTARHPDVPAELRGTYAGLAHPAFVEHLQPPRGHRRRAAAGAPLRQRAAPAAPRPDQLLGLQHARLLRAARRLQLRRAAAAARCSEFKTMVKALHAAGIEVILDVVYNHTAEGDHTGPTLSFRGIDNAGYYRLDGGRPRRYIDYTGCGNTLNVRHPHVLQLIMDSLRYWVTEMHVDGFRFDLASALARALHDVDRLSAFFDVIHQDPVVSQVKLIAEPWDVGDGRLPGGQLPAAVDGVERQVPRHRPRLLGAARTSASATSPTGSPAPPTSTRADGRRPFASINFVTAHDGFTLRDLVTYEQQAQRGQRRGQPRRRDHNRSWNCGVEGPTDDPEVQALRARQVRNLLATLLLSTGRADAARRRRARPHPARQQQRLLPGQRDLLVRLEGTSTTDLLALRLAAGRAAPRLAGAAPAGVLRGPRDPRAPAGHPRPGLVRPGRRRADHRDWFDAGLQTLGMYLDGRGHPAPRRARPAGRRRLLPGAAARRRRAGRRCSCPGRRGPTATSWWCPPSTPPARPPETTVVAPGAVELPARCVWLLRVLRRP